jgi:hypothetical protein
MLSLSNTGNSLQAPGDELRAGTYLTDGRRLLYVVSPFNPSYRRMYAFIEDCMTLEVHPYSPSEMYDMGLRLVRAPAV